MENNIVLIVCMSLGFLCWAAAAFFAIQNRKNVKSVIRFAGIGVFTSVFFFLYPYAVARSGYFAIPFALLQVMATAVVGSDPLDVIAVVSKEYPDGLLGTYQAILMILHVIAPLFTIGITLSFFENKFAPLFYRLRSVHHASHVFSEINERTLCLAESIHRSDSKSLFAFIGDPEDLEEKQTFFTRVQNVGGIVLNIAIDALPHNLKKERTYYLMGNDSSRNLKDAIRLFEKFDKIGGEMIKIWLYSKDEISSVIFDHLDEKIDIRLVNEEQLIARGFMQSYPLYRGIRDDRFVFLLIGGGHIGLEILRNALWCASFGNNVATEFHVMDLDGERAAQSFEKSCPGMASDYGVHFHSANVKTASYPSLLQSIQPTFMVICLGEEQLNISASVFARRIYGNENDYPAIHVLIDHEDTASLILSNLKVSDWSFSREKDSFQRKPLGDYSILPFGSYAQTYSSVRFSKGYYDQLAIAINSVHYGIKNTDEVHDDEFFRDLLNKVEFYKDFSYAYAISIPYKLWMMGLELVPDGEGELSHLKEALPLFEKELMEQEQQRWGAFMRSMGWKALPLDQVKNGCYQDKMKKLHARLDISHVKDLGDMVGRDFEAENRQDLYRLPDILRLANSLSEQKYSVRKMNK